MITGRNAEAAVSVKDIVQMWFLYLGAQDRESKGEALCGNGEDGVYGCARVELTRGWVLGSGA